MIVNRDQDSGGGGGGTGLDRTTAAPPPFQAPHHFTSIREGEQGKKAAEDKCPLREEEETLAGKSVHKKEPFCVKPKREREEEDKVYSSWAMNK